MNQKHIIITTILVLLMCSGTASAAWANTSYTNAKNITLLGADTQLTNYPYLVSVAKESAMQSDYDDLIFYDQPVWSSGNLIEFEIETYNATVATIWLNITTLPTAGKTVSVYYGNATVGSTENSNATWNSDYVGVWHLADDINSYAGSSYSSSILDKYSCWGVVDMLQDPNNLEEHIITWQRLETEIPYLAYINYSVYNTTTESYSNPAHVFDNSNGLHQGHAAWGYFGDKYHVALAQTDGTADYIIEINNTTWAGINDHVFVSNEWRVTPDLGWRSQPSYLVINSSSTWLLCPDHNSAGTSYAGYVPWSASDGWGSWTQITQANHTNRLHTIRGVVKDSVIYIYYTTWAPDVIYMIKTSDYGVTWSEPVNLGLTGVTGYSTPTVHIRNDKFVMIYGTVDTVNSMLMYRSNDGETFTDSETVVSESGVMSAWNWINDTHVLLTYPDKDSFASERGDLDSGILNIGNYLTFQCSGSLIIRDSTSNDNTGVADGGESVSGIIGDAINFTSDVIVVDTNDFYDEGTISWWQDGGGGGQMTFAASNNTSSSNDWTQIGFDASLKEYSFWNGAEGADIFRSNANMVQTSESQHVAYTSDGFTTKCFVNGTEVSLTATAGANVGKWFNNLTTPDEYSMGARKTGTLKTEYYSGILDEIKLSQTARSADWIDISYQTVVNSSYVAFGAEETYGASTNDITLAANTYGFLRKDVTAAQAFSTIAAGFVHKVCFSWLDNSGACWESYWSGDTYNSALSIPKNDAYFVLIDGTGETVSCGVRAAGNVAIPVGWYATYLGESTAKTLTQIKTDIQSDGDVTNLYTWDHNAGGTGAWISVDVTPSHSVLPNQGILINNMGAPYNWDGTVS